MVACSWWRRPVPAATSCRSGSASWSVRSGYASVITGSSAPPAAAVALVGIGAVAAVTVTVAAGQAAPAAAAMARTGTVPGTQITIVNARPAHRYS
jgi:hypothetical protein